MPELDGKSMCPGDGLKKAWREDTPKGVLKAAGLPTSKSMVKAMIAVIGRHHNELPNLSLIKMLYYISGNNVDVARAALLATCHVPFERPDIRLANCSIAMKALVSNFSKRERMDFINEVIDAARVRPPEEIDLRNRYHSTPGYVADIISMAKTVYKEHKAIPMPVRGMVRVHDELAVLESAIRNPELNNSIKYDKEVKAVDNAVLAGNSRIALPRTGTEIHSAGQQLHNCLAGYAPRAQRGDLMILFVKDFDGKLTGAMEIRNKKLIQLGGFANKVMDPFVSNAVWTTLHQAKIISEMPDVSNLDRVYYR